MKLRKFLLGVLAAALLASPALAGSLVTGVNPTTTAIPICLAGQFITSTDGVNLSCAAAGGGSNVTISAGQGISVTGGPAYVIGTSFPVVTKTAAYTFASGDASHTFVYNSLAPGTFTFPQSGSAGFTNGWGICVMNRSTGALSLVQVSSATSVFYGGPTTFNKDQGACIQADDTGNWAIFSGVSPVIPNPNAFQ